MAKRKEPESFEVTEYSGENEIESRFRTISQIVLEKVSDQPNCTIRVSVTGEVMRVTYHSYEMHMPTRFAVVQDQAKSYLDEMLRHIKKEFKSRTGTVLELKEDKSLANYSIEKVSLNERYHYAAWRCYDLK